MNNSIYQQGTPATDDYSIFPSAVAEAPPEQVTVAEKKPPVKVRRSKGPEFYKPFELLLLVYLYFYCSRIPEMVPWLHIGLLLQPMLLIGMLMTSTTKELLKSDVGRYMTIFTIWVTICVPFSTWKGGSFQILQLAAQALLLMFFMASFLRTLDDCYRAIYIVALAMATIGVLAILHGAAARAGDPRMALGKGESTLADANFLALYIVIGLPAVWFTATWKKGIMKTLIILMVGPMLLGFGRTGSRMGMLALAAAALFYLVFASMSQRIVLIMGGFICLVLAVVLLPGKIIERFTTFFQAQSAASEEAAESANARKTMLMKGIELTLEHPFVGVGPGEFMDAEAKEAALQNRRGLWHFTHNAYTEVSSETGILGLIFFMLAFWRTYRGLSIYRDRFPRKDARRAAMAIQMMVLIAAIGAFFLSIAYSGILYVIMGLSAAFQIAAAREWKLLKAAEA